MWNALDNAVALAKSGSLLYIALYDYEIQVNPSPEFWLDVKHWADRMGLKILTMKTGKANTEYLFGK